MPYKNPEDAKAAHKRWREKNPEKVKANVRKWREENPERWKETARLYVKKWRNENREAWDDIQRRTRFRLEPEDYHQMLTEQQNACAICQREVKLAVDHDHETGKVRGLLCRSCNTGLGQFKDNPTLLERAISYLRSKQ